jgi:sigma-B regulation protein RsbU (phosphoserine phosphatase)
MKRIKLKITAKILLVLLGLSLVSLLIFMTVSLNNMVSLREYALKSTTALGARAVEDSSSALKLQAEEELLMLAIDQAALSNALFDKVSSEADVISNFVIQMWSNPQQVPTKHIYFQAEKPDTIYAASVAILAPGVSAEAVSGDLKLCASLDNIFIPILQNDYNVTQIYLGTESGIAQLYPWATGIPATFDPREREWYKTAKQTRTSGWTNVMIDAVSNKPMITFFRPIYDNDRKLIGVVGADVTIETINQKIINTQVGKNGYAFLVDSHGSIIAHPGMQIKNKKWDETLEMESLLQTKNQDLFKMVGEMITGNSGVNRMELEGSEKYIAYAPITRTGWSIAVVMPVAEIVAPIEATKGLIDTATADFSKNINNQINLMQLILVLTTVGMLLIVAVAASLLSRRITQPIVALNKGVKVIGRGDLGHRLDVQTGDEIQDLAGAFNKMAEDLQEYIRDLKETTSAKERIESELRVATEIQSSMLPRLFPPFPDRKEFDLYATMNSAREVAGDFYDFFFVGKNKLYFVIGDVCGKGIPAALFMAISKTLLRTEGLRGFSPEEVLFSVNNTLYPDNEASMFFTGLCAVLDTETGEITIANGGHNPPIISYGGKPFEYIQLPKGLVVGAMPDTKYESRTYKLKPHDTIFLYTDGVTEAMDPDQKLYSEARLLKFLNGMQGKSVDDIIRGVRADIDVFARGAEQWDDITMLSLEYNGNIK